MDNNARRIRSAGIFYILLLSACTSPAPVTKQPPPPSPPAAAARPAPLLPPLTLEGYKKSVADRIASASADVFGEPLPEVFKSIVVLDITIDREGRLTKVGVHRSNGFKALESRAIESVRQAAPFSAPAFTVRRSDGSVNFLETFLFRDDGRFQIRSLVQQMREAAPPA